jgi:neutral ceramidase
VRDFIAEPSANDIKCHGSKPILLATGRAVFPYAWQPTIVPLQIFSIGDLLMFGLPGEFTTMAGRRLKNEIQLFAKSRSHEFQSILCGLSNIYSSYITTPEEYEIQRYEGASTIFGPHTLTIYMSRFIELLDAMMQGKDVNPGPFPKNQDSKQISLVTKVYYDGHAFGSGFGYVLRQPLKSYQRGSSVYTKFVSGNPRNNLMTDSSYFFVERQISDGDEWKTVATDANWETKFKWTRVSMILGRSEIEFSWEIPQNAEPGNYRIRHTGFYRYILGGIYPYQGSTEIFQVQ